MPPPHFPINPVQLGIELTSTIIIAILAIIIFVKTKELASISKKKSISLFRYSFLFFGLAYVLRFLMMTSRVTVSLSSLFHQFPGMTFLIFTPLVIFFSLTAIMTLTSSVIKKFQDKKHILLYICLISFAISIISFLSQAMIILVILELILFIVAFVLMYMQNKRIRKKRKQLYWIYYLLFLAWLMSLFITIPVRVRIPHEIIIIPHIISIIVFSIILRKVSKLN
ncbi:hypothetical protein JXA48_00560 [Candidatus Woesearchaeota archaeon]|nr:hypothetical protein [Candidatus Woesearchaeota archaeon]